MHTSMCLELITYLALALQLVAPLVPGEKERYEAIDFTTVNISSVYYFLALPIRATLCLKF